MNTGRRRFEAIERFLPHGHNDAENNVSCPTRILRSHLDYSSLRDAEALKEQQTHLYNHDDILLSSVPV